jgi:hypothetical protein
MKGSEIKESVVFGEVVVGCSIGRGKKNHREQKSRLSYTNNNPYEP